MARGQALGDHHAVRDGEAPVGVVPVRHAAAHGGVLAVRGERGVGAEVVGLQEHGQRQQQRRRQQEEEVVDSHRVDSLRVDHPRAALGQRALGHERAVDVLLGAAVLRPAGQRKA